MGRITVIPSSIKPISNISLSGLTKRRVAGYARVSTDSDEQFTSFAAQKDYYHKFIESHEGWTYIDVYADEGLSGTSMKRRAGFNTMIEDALSGKIDLIVTKSISRFARNTVDTLVTIRKLKEKGVEVYFEKENIYTLDSKGELLITIMSSLAQEESHSISDNVKWGQRKAFSDGKVRIPFKHFLGYQRGENGQIEINETEAKTVRDIYAMFLFGMTQNGIVKVLNDKGVPTPTGRSKWTWNSVNSILINEKYKGDALLQKTFVVDFLSHKVKKNDGEIPKYYVENSHPAIIDKDNWDMVQEEINYRKSLKTSYSGIAPFYSRVVCAECGNLYGRKVWHSTSKYKSVVYRCNNKFENKCGTPILEEETIKKAFVRAYNLTSNNKENAIEGLYLMRSVLDNLDELNKKIEERETEIAMVVEYVKKLVEDNRLPSDTQEEFARKYDEARIRHDKENAMLEELLKEKSRKSKQLKDIDSFIEAYKKSPDVLLDWDDRLWILMVEKAMVHQDGSIEFIFKSGKKVTV